MQLPRRQFLHLAAGAAALPAMPRLAMAQSYPRRPVHIIVGVAAGGPNDTVARLLGQWLSERLGQQFVVENRTGAGGNIATEEVVRAAADGYTLMLVTSANAAQCHALRKVQLQFRFPTSHPSRAIMRVPNRHGGQPVGSGAERWRVHRARQGQSGQVTWPRPGIGTTPHMSGELFNQTAGVDLVPVAVSRRRAGADRSDRRTGSGDVRAHDIDGPLRAGRQAARARGDQRRPVLALLPDVPTVADTVPGYEVSQWFGIGAPRSTPADVVARLHDEINAAMADPKLAARLAELGGMPTPMTTAEFGKLVVDETAKWAKVVKTANIKPE